jgi:hypothetical protein
VKEYIEAQSQNYVVLDAPSYFELLRIYLEQQ